LLGSAAGLGLLAGIRLYFTVFAVGLAVRLGWFDPSPAYGHLQLLGQTPILLASGVLLICEFVADKIPWFDSIWDAVHTFIRPVGAAALGIMALGNVDQTTPLLIGLLSGGVALTGHASKAAARIAVNHSPEPISNWLLSFAEDALVPVGLWVVMKHPVYAGIGVAVFLVAFAFLAHAVWKFFRRLFTRGRGSAAFGRSSAA